MLNVLGDLITDRKNICFAILVHENREAVKDMLDNIAYFCPNSSIVLFNGGDDLHLCDSLNYLVCPTSRKLEYGITGTYILEVMEWLERIKFDYKYIINLDSDALFAKEGFEQFVIREMMNKNADYMGVDVRVPRKSWWCGKCIRPEWKNWQPLFDSDDFLGCFNVGQIFSKRYVKRLLKYKKFDQFRKTLYHTKVFGIDEIAFVTMARTLGFNPKKYPRQVSRSIRYRPHFSCEEIKDYLKNHPKAYLFHPVERDMKNEVRTFIRNSIPKT